MVFESVVLLEVAICKNVVFINSCRFICRVNLLVCRHCSVGACLLSAFFMKSVANLAKLFCISNIGKADGFAVCGKRDKMIEWYVGYGDSGNEPDKMRIRLV